MKWIPIAALLVVAGAAAATEPLTREALEKSFFQSIGVKQGDPPQLLLHFKTSGTRFLCSRNDQDEKVNDYDEVMAVNPGDTFSVSEHHTGLEFRPLPKPYEKHGWLLESEFDARSFGGDVTTRYGILLLVKTPAGTDIRFLEPQENFDPKLPPSDPTYRAIEKAIAQTEPLLRHELTGVTPAGEAAPPFSQNVETLVFRWEFAPGHDTAPIEVRWIAAEVNGVAKDHLIASAGSEAGKTAGEFTLKKPVGGFPPGRYRVEIWQRNSAIFRQLFEVMP